MKFKLLLLSCVLCLAAGSLAAEPRGWPGAYPGRLQAPAQAEPSPGTLLTETSPPIIEQNRLVIALLDLGRPAEALPIFERTGLDFVPVVQLDSL